MALHIEEHVVRAFDENVRLLFEQGASRLRQYCDVRTGVVGKAKSFNRIEGGDAQEKAGSGHRHEDHTQDDLDGIVSWAVLRYFYKALPLDPDDEDKVLASPKNRYVEAIAGALGRKLDELILAAAIGSATRGEDMAGSVALPSAQKIAAASLGLTVGKLIAAWEMMSAAEIPDDGRVMAVNASMMADLLGATEVTSIDFNTQKTLVNAKLPSFMAFEFVRTEKIISTGTGATGAVAWHKTGIGVAIAREYNRIAQRHDKHDLWEAYGSCHFGCVREEDKAVVQVLVA